MTTEAEFLARADEADRKADEMGDGPEAAEMRGIAEQWRVMARHSRRAFKGPVPPPDKPDA